MWEHNSIFSNPKRIKARPATTLDHSQHIATYLKIVQDPSYQHISNPLQKDKNKFDRLLTIATINPKFENTFMILSRANQHAKVIGVEAVK